jgi:hypothetical protein
MLFSVDMGAGRTKRAAAMVAPNWMMNNKDKRRP